MQPWKLNETYELVKVAFGPDQVDLVRDSVRSVGQRQDFARYHYREARRLAKRFESQHLGDGPLLDIYTQHGRKKRLAFESFIVKAGAHMTAAVQSIHSIPDILANAAYYSTAQNLAPQPLAERDISVPKVVKRLQAANLNTLAASLQSSQSGKGWAHLAALSNLSKHRSVVRMALNEDLTGEREEFRELRFSSFAREGKSFPAISSTLLLEPEYERVSKVVLACGIDINSFLSHVATSQVSRAK